MNMQLTLSPWTAREQSMLSGFAAERFARICKTFWHLFRRGKAR